MFRYACMILFLVLVSEIQLSCSTEVSVNDTAHKLCLYANLNVNFTVTYEAIGKVNHTAEFILPAIVNASGSTCDKDTSTLELRFGKGHSWTIKFTKENKTYNAHDIVFTYNLTDDSIFKNASSNETKSVTFTQPISDVSMDTYYSCKSEDTMEKGLVVQTLWNVSMQAFIINGTKSDKDTVCAMDRTTTPMPTTHITNATTPPAPTTPSPLPTPKTGNYSVSGNHSVCLLASMGLQISFKHGLDFKKMNIDPEHLNVNGNCSVNKSDATLVLRSDQMDLTFTFQEDGKKFRLHAVNFMIKLSNGTFTASNTNLSIWEAAVGSSYMCNKEQSYNITDTFSVNTFSLQVQPFEVNGNAFATAEECFLDADLSFLVPVAVGVALSFLIILVLLSYLIGRRKSRTGYQSV
ncbi:lysosome-associated membrane glycoprotein 2 isoform X2 [Anguilla rostrata]|uniref:lysosome-associated membrane glycoprotein 2 isoform X2 n=1 Tax=Anguilla rostrata TaxID=7938 RepID=UPI0030CAC06C